MCCYFFFRILTTGYLPIIILTLIVPISTFMGESRYLYLSSFSCLQTVDCNLYMNAVVQVT